MGLFDRKIKCEKFFTYKTNAINISGLSAGLTGEQVAGFDLKVGQFKLDPKFVEASELLQQLDMLQYSTCQTISGISSKEKRNELLEKLADIKMKMLLIAQNPEKVEDIKLPENTKTEISKPENMNTTHAKLKKLLVDNKKVGEALKLLQNALPNENTVIMFLADYNQIMEDIENGLSSFNSAEWKSLKHRIMQFVDRKEDEIK
ncbi:MAG: hypothetical protein B6I20_09615 [Bacteroidetes bacterium 4572_117]|nr:MAG: hypothetical protein B6I20_09615 [Bacteroidetes bacterium 4572_117]